MAYSDNFDSYSNNYSLADAVNWDIEKGSVIVLNSTGTAGTVRGNSGTDHAIFYNTAVAADQYAQITVSRINSSSTYIGVAVRIKGDASGTYYGWYGSSSDSQFQKWVNGVYSTGWTGDAWVLNSVYKLSITGNTLSFYKDGSLDTSFIGGGTWTDSSSPLTTGYVGIAAYGSSDTEGDLWEGGAIGTTYNGVLYMYNGASWEPRPLNVYGGPFAARPVWAYYNAQWNLIQSF
jgi:hypothetical protein